VLRASEPKHGRLWHIRKLRWKSVKFWKYFWVLSWSRMIAVMMILVIRSVDDVGFFIARLHPTAVGPLMPGFSRHTQRQPSAQHSATCARSVNGTSWRRGITSLFRRPLNPARRVTSFWGFSASVRLTQHGQLWLLQLLFTTYYYYNNYYYCH